MSVKNLFVIMPVYNEKDCVTAVVDEWMPVLEKYSPGAKLLALNDGSKDNSLQILKSLQQKYSSLEVIDKPNSGHGQSCILGYREAIVRGADWIFQIDSDGQCDPAYFGKMIEGASKDKVVYGFRRTRDDGARRYVISRLVSVFAYAATGVWVRDANVPYRLMHKDTIAGIINKVPADFHLANILVAVLQEKNFGIRWVDIHFRKRMGGVASVKAYSFAKHGMRLFRQLRQAYSDR